MAIIWSSALRGQLKENGELFGKLGLSKNDLKNLWGVFSKIDSDHGGVIELEELLNWCSLPRTDFTERAFSCLDSDDGGTLSFREFVSSIWNYCTTEKSTMTNFVFDLYDTDKSGEIEATEIERMLHDVYGDTFSTNVNAQLILKSLQVENRDQSLGTDFNVRMSYDEFVIWLEKHGAILWPVFQMQQVLRERVMGFEFWERCSKIRQLLKEGRGHEIHKLHNSVGPLEFVKSIFFPSMKYEHEEHEEGDEEFVFHRGGQGNPDDKKKEANLADVQSKSRAAAQKKALGVGQPKSHIVLSSQVIKNENRRTSTVAVTPMQEPASMRLKPLQEGDNRGSVRGKTGQVIGSPGGGGVIHEHQALQRPRSFHSKPGSPGSKGEPPVAKFERRSTAVKPGSPSSAGSSRPGSAIKRPPSARTVYVTPKTGEGAPVFEEGRFVGSGTVSPTYKLGGGQAGQRVVTVH